MNGYLGGLRRSEVGVPREMGSGFGNAKPMPVPDHLDYDMWLGPAPEAPYTVDRVHPETHNGRPGWMRVLDYCEGVVTNWGTAPARSARSATSRSGAASVWNGIPRPSDSPMIRMPTRCSPAATAAPGSSDIRVRLSAGLVTGQLSRASPRHRGTGVTENITKGSRSFS